MPDDGITYARRPGHPHRANRRGRGWIQIYAASLFLMQGATLAGDKTLAWSLVGKALLLMVPALILDAALMATRAMIRMTVAPTRGE